MSERDSFLVAAAMLVASAVQTQAGNRQEVPHGRYFAKTLLCDDGFKDVGGRCQPLPSVTNGHYYMATLLCDDGFKDVGGRCQPLPSVTNGHYYMATLLCDDGFRSLAGRCDRLAPVTNGQYSGEVAICDPGYAFMNGTCQPGNDASPISRIDPRYVARSRLAAPIDLDGLTSDVAPFSTSTLATGSSFDARSGNSYRWTRSADGTTNVRGMNVNAGSLWQTTITPNGSMNGYDSKFNPWRYDARTSVYINYGTGKMCMGKGAARTCF